MLIKNYAKTVKFVVSGVAIALIYVLTLGVLTAQAIGLRGGAVLNLNNELVGVQDPSVPYLQIVAVMGVGLLAAYAVWYAPRRLPTSNQLALTIGFFSTSVALVVYSYAFIERGNPMQSIATGELEGWEGWLLKASNESSLHLVLALAFCLGVYQVIGTLRGSARSSSESGTGGS
ncbi:hypothetical protein CQ010_04835 [Arthrobacter sp. MYb211]|uniref:hypothetical protein n=1 Tax=Micrococcaceae TaxID=1268 RepID=UPI000BB79142|nr:MULTISPECIES: hypothetical protein [Micrococcaceae]PCC29558.1 hypothetical protein CIK76_06125 [Glutamicibacter sp. BW80]PRA01105.1 hypothetical protein CQ017_00945 [Arthrobacter sp. MYb224]PRA06734.1 hypothetical protein CQ019_04995 [Arthrobacter sp. MYb229]PRA13874.1 hypothetical protein CQ015_00830 [Arthrobacter sp. MYb221]PRB53635.1 hypothetical protein CQ013_04995 [Arthrobacter sp. MYb216]